MLHTIILPSQIQFMIKVPAEEFCGFDFSFIQNNLSKMTSWILLDQEQEDKAKQCPTLFENKENYENKMKVK